MFRIRFHGRGGQGIKTASRILGRALFLEGFEVQDAPRYGAERRGAPIFAYVRADRAPIDERGIISRPDLVVVADDSLVQVPAAGVLSGVSPKTVLLICSRETAEVWRYRLALAGPVRVLPVPEEAEDRLALRTLGSACAGAAARLTGQVGAQALDAAVATELSAMTPEVIDRNREQAAYGYQLMAEHTGLVVAGGPSDARDYPSPGWVDLDAEPVVLGGPAIRAPATSEQQETGLWRTLRPVIDQAHCNRCWWVCSSACPDGAISVGEGGQPSIDYDHCKGCLVCVSVCPPHAIAALPELGAEAS